MTTMESRLLSTFFGILLGLAVSLLVHVILFEHLTLFLILPILPIVGVSIGMFLGIRKKLPAMKIYASLAIFTAIFAFTMICLKAKEIFLQAQRESIATSIAVLSPNSNIVKVAYDMGNGMEVPPNVEVLMSSKIAFSEVFNYYNVLLKKNDSRQWQDMFDGVGGKWQSKNFALYINNRYRERGQEDYRIAVYFYGPWIAQIFAIESFRKELLSGVLQN